MEDQCRRWCKECVWVDEVRNLLILEIYHTESLKISIFFWRLISQIFTAGLHLCPTHKPLILSPAGASIGLSVSEYMLVYIECAESWKFKNFF